MTDERIAKAAKLREKAARFRSLTACTSDETTLEILQDMIRKNEEEAQRLEREADAEHAA